MTTEITWGSLWWRIRLLARVWWSDARRWLVARRRARRLGPRWRKKCRELGIIDRFSKAQAGHPIPLHSAAALDRAAKLAYLEQRSVVSTLELAIGGVAVTTLQAQLNRRHRQQLEEAHRQLERERLRRSLQQLSVVRRLPLIPPEHDDDAT